MGYEETHEELRKPIAAMEFKFDPRNEDRSLIVVCDDGAVFERRPRESWEEVTPVPGTLQALKRDRKREQS